MKKTKKLKVKRKKIIRNEERFNLEFEKARLSIEIPVTTKEDFKEAVEKSGKTMKDVLEAYMQRYSLKVLKGEEIETESL
ncbi:MULTISPECIES: hypothetical protein [Bacillus cereus group]|uniref:hypothetical protein n=1 Tax=Bacillus cereus group TaxID=86661 RepID=UPI000BF14960|nr:MULTISPECIES: hypothetical protein [Bacillus cereus group]PEK36186.1 hypothetical protein CN897_08330 [Bacillus toyonensis]PEW23970.1 hypothetical protein CN441_30970 [Bacillus cereus]